MNCVMGLIIRISIFSGAIIKKNLLCLTKDFSHVLKTVVLATRVLVYMNLP